MKIKTLILITLTSIASSCKINGSFQGLYSYYDKTKAHNPDLFINHSSLNKCNFNETDRKKIIITTGTLLKQCIPNENTVIYMWSPKCRSQFCYDLNILQQSCNQKKINLLIVAEYYDSNLMTVEYDLTNPIFGIDTKHYKTNLTSKYCELFYEDLVSQNNVKNRLLHFKDGVFINSYNDINELN